MKIQINDGQGSILATHVTIEGKRRKLFVSPWGASLDALPPAPKGADAKATAYALEVSDDLGETILGSALGRRISKASTEESAKPSRSSRSSKG